MFDKSLQECICENNQSVIVQGSVDADKLIKPSIKNPSSCPKIIYEDLVFTLRKKGNNAYLRIPASSHNGVLIATSRYTVYDACRESGLPRISCNARLPKTELAELIDKYAIQAEPAQKRIHVCLFYEGTQEFPQELVLAEFDKFKEAAETGNWGTDVSINFYRDAGGLEYSMNTPSTLGDYFSNTPGDYFSNNLIGLSIAISEKLQRRLRSVNGISQR